MKNWKKCALIGMVAIIVLSFVGCDGGDNGNGGNDGGGSGNNPTITIKNNTGYHTSGAFIKPSTETRTWGDSGWSIPDGTSRDYTLDQPLSVQKVYDIRLNWKEWSVEYDFIKYGVTISNKMTITFTTNDLNDMSSLPKITIQNRSGKDFNSVYIVPTDLHPSDPTDWGESFGTISNNFDKSSITILIPPTNYTVFDIQARSTNPTNTYTKTNVTISNGMTILFTPLDRVNSTIEDPVIVVQNNTGYYIYHIWTRQSGSETWEENLTGGWSIHLPDGESLAFSVPQSLGNQIDIKLSDGNGSYNFINSGVTISDGLLLTFTASDGQ
jgi:hypothetical protein